MPVESCWQRFRRWRWLLGAVIASGVWIVACGKETNTVDNDPGSAGSAAATGNGGGGSGNAAGGAGIAGGIGGMAGAADAAVDAGLHVDQRPPPPMWNPPIPLGAPGWRQSTEPLCEAYRGHYTAYDIWADQRGVFALFGIACQNLDGKGPCSGEGTTLQFNDGSGWRTIYDTRVAGRDTHLAGMPGGSLMLFPKSCGSMGFGISRMGRNAVRTCAAAVTGPEVDSFGTGPDLAYGIDSNLSMTRVLKLAGGESSVVSTLPMSAFAVWADAQSVVAVGEKETVFVKTGTSDFVRLSNVPAGDYGSVCGYGANDLWMQNNAAQLVHYNGTTWDILWPGGTGYFGDLWGDGTHVYFHTGALFGRWNGTKVEFLLGEPNKPLPGLVRGLTGISSSEVFVAYRDPQFDNYQCGGEFILWFDGKQFHRF